VALGHNPQTWAKVLVGVVGVIAAIAAAVKETAQYGKRSLAHETASSEYENIRYGVENLRDELKVELVTAKDAEDKLKDLENQAEAIIAKAPALSNGAFRRATKFIKRLRKRRTELFPDLTY
jgi:hypothetical protein